MLMHVNNTERRILPTKFTTATQPTSFTFVCTAVGLKYIAIYMYICVSLLNNQYYIIWYSL